MAKGKGSTQAAQGSLTSGQPNALNCNTPVLQCAMPKEAYINARVDRQLKTRAEKVLAQVGVSTTDAVTMLLHQIVLRRGLPFEVRIPNRETISAMGELDDGKNEALVAATEEIFETAVKRDRRRV
jgi:DNA-damage-inducible protein J